MKEDRLHGFCFVRTFWNSILWLNRSSLLIWALNPFRLAEPSGPRTMCEAYVSYLNATYARSASGGRYQGNGLQAEGQRDLQLAAGVDVHGDVRFQACEISKA